MDSWTPLFSKIVRSSIWREEDTVRIVFITMLALRDQDNIVRLSAFEIAECAKYTEQQVLDALKVLQSPDTKRIEPQPHDGRRVEKVEGGYLILNGKVYQDLMKDIGRKIYKARKSREYYAKKTGKSLEDFSARRAPNAGEQEPAA